MSDGVINIALLKVRPEKEKTGLFHFGMWVDDLDEAEKKVTQAGGTYLAGRCRPAQVRAPRSLRQHGLDRADVRPARFLGHELCTLPQRRQVGRQHARQQVVL